MNDQAVLKELAVGFEYSYIHDDWVNPLEEALDGVTIQEALWKFAPDSKSIWDIVLHMAVWNENIVQRIESGEVVRPKEGAWPPLPELLDKAGWERSKKRLWDSLKSVQAMLESSSLEKIQAGPYGMGDLLCRFIHNGYHLGQITKLRECMPQAD